jgi:hypothetical protein
MNFFFGLRTQFFTSELQIPTFQNRNQKKKNINLYEVFIENNKWKLEKINSKYHREDFYLLNNKLINNKKIFFLGYPEDFANFNHRELEDLNEFTNTSPDFRSNFKINLKNGGFSSFQSEYPFEMTKKKGSILSQISSLANIDAKKNYLIFKNIYYLPIEQKFNGYFVNCKTKMIEATFELLTNNTNIVEIEQFLIKPEIFFVTNEYLGIPMYLSEKNGHLSLEHTHPPHEYIMGENRYKRVSSLKKEINEIIS